MPDGAPTPEGVFFGSNFPAGTFPRAYQVHLVLRLAVAAGTLPVLLLCARMIRLGVTLLLQPSPPQGATGACVIGLSVGSIAAFLLLMAWRERIELDRTSITRVTALRSRTLGLADIGAIRTMRARGGGAMFVIEPAQPNLKSITIYPTIARDDILDAWLSAQHS